MVGATGGGFLRVSRLEAALERSFCRKRVLVILEVGLLYSTGTGVMVRAFNPSEILTAPGNLCRKGEGSASARLRLKS